MKVSVLSVPVRDVNSVATNAWHALKTADIGDILGQKINEAIAQSSVDVKRYSLGNQRAWYTKRSWYAHGRRVLWEQESSQVTLIIVRVDALSHELRHYSLLVFFRIAIRPQYTTYLSYLVFHLINYKDGEDTSKKPHAKQRCHHSASPHTQCVTHWWLDRH